MDQRRGSLCLPADIPSGVEIVVKRETRQPRFYRKAERPERQIVTHKMQTVSHFHEYLLKKISGYESRIVFSLFDGKLR